LCQFTSDYYENMELRATTTKTVYDSFVNESNSARPNEDLPLSLHFFYSDVGKPEFALGFIPIRILTDEESVLMAE